MSSVQFQLATLACKLVVTCYRYRTSVDSQQKPLIFSAAAWLKATFPDRLTLTLGDSLNDVPMLWRRLRPDGMRPQARLLDDFPEACDLTLVDGGHDLRFAYPDMRNFRCAARVGSGKA